MSYLYTDIIKLEGEELNVDVDDNLTINEKEVSGVALEFETDIDVTLLLSQKTITYVNLEFVTDATVEFDLEEATLSWQGTYLEWETDGTVNFNVDLEEGETFIDRINLNVYVTTGGIIDPENPLIITMTPDINEFPPIYTELGTFSNFTLSASKSPVVFSLSGVSPQELELVGSTLVGGDVLEMDLYVPAFAMPPGIEIMIDGSHYATYGSALAGSYMFNFTVVASYEEMGITEYAYLPVSLLVRNNYSSDRDKLIHDISETFGELGSDMEYRYFEIDGTRVTAAEFISHQKANGFYG
jgi:hypothetical protein